MSLVLKFVREDQTRSKRLEEEDNGGIRGGSEDRVDRGSAVVVALEGNEVPGPGGLRYASSSQLGDT